MDGEIYDEAQSMARRDNPRVRKFRLRRCWPASASPRTTARSASTTKRDERHQGLHLITRYFRAERDLSATVGGQQIPLQRGERIGLNFQYLYTPGSLRLAGAEQGGLEILNGYESPDGRFVTAVCRR